MSLQAFSSTTITLADEVMMSRYSAVLENIIKSLMDSPYSVTVIENNGEHFVGVPKTKSGLLGKSTSVTWYNLKDLIVNSDFNTIHLTENDYMNYYNIKMIVFG